MEYTTHILCDSPYVATYDSILSDDECKHFIDISMDSMKRSLVSETNIGIVSNGRTGCNTWVRHDHDDITKKVGERIANIVGMPLENAESFQVIYYNKTQEYRQHYDSWVHDGSIKTHRCMKWGGARIKTALCYLNNVPSGGGTRMTKLNVTIQPEKGKLLVFNNTISNDDHTRHELSEHAGLPVEEGEKYAFNLWFKETKATTLYKDFNPGYYINNETPVPVKTTTFVLDVKNSIRMHTDKDMFVVKSFVNEPDDSIINTIFQECKLNTRDRRDGWVNLSKVPQLIKNLETITGISSSFYENMNIVEYKENVPHPLHFDAYDLHSDSGKKNTSLLGQRIATITLLLTDNIIMDFTSINTKCELNKGDLLVYKNVMDNSSERDSDLRRSIVCKSGTGYLANIYVRTTSNNNDKLILKDTEMKITELENYSETLDNVFNKFKNGNIAPNWGGLDSFKYNFKGDFESFKSYISRYNTIRTKCNALNQENFETDYKLDDKLPIQVVNNVLNIELLELLRKYYQETIDKNVWVLGDRQSKRYKAHNEPMSRFIHYECLPLIEKIVGKPMKPTYTYLSAYVNGAELPQHTDRPDCEYTVSFVVDKPVGSNWNIYVHKPQQQIKYKGRYDEKPPLDECEPVDCDAGGLMLFQGTDHIHFRNKLEFDYYNVLLLHYCSV